jgi:hypothetical protein
MLTTKKPLLEKGIRKDLRRNKWEHFEEVKYYLERQGINYHVFTASKKTPHIRILDRIDYWPASTRFFDFKLKAWGVSWNSLKLHIQKNTKVNVKVQYADKAKGPLGERGFTKNKDLRTALAEAHKNLKEIDHVLKNILSESL